MIINNILNYLQKFLKPIYNESFFLKNIDWLIFVCIISIILTSTFMPSDNIGYFAILTIILTGIKVITKNGDSFRISGADKFLLLYFIFVLISVAGSSLLILSIKGFCKTLTYLGFYIAFVHYLKDNLDKLKYILFAFILASFAEFFIALKQNFLSVSEISGWQDMSRLNAEEIMTRVYGSLKPYNPNLFGGYMLAILPTNLIMIFIPLINKHYKTAFCGLTCFIMGLITILLTGCRGAYIGLLAELVVLFFITYHYLKPYYKKVFVSVSSFFSIIAISVILATSSLRARIFSIFAMRGDSSNSFRFNVYNSCIEMFKDNWLLGIGVGNQNFREIYGLYMKTGFDALSAYNIYLETAVESGIFALLSFLAFILLNMHKAIRYIFRRKNAKSVYLTVAILSLTGLLVHGLVDTVFFRPQIHFVFWIMIGIIRVITFSNNTRGIKRVRARNQ